MATEPVAGSASDLPDLKYHCSAARLPQDPGVASVKRIYKYYKK